MRQRVTTRLKSLPGGTLTWSILTELARRNITDRSMTLAAQAFTSVLPVVILLTTLPGAEVVRSGLSGLGIDPSKLDLSEPISPGSFTAFGIVGALMVIIGATSLSRALGRMYVSVWTVSRLSLRGWWRWVLVILLIPLAGTIQGLIASMRSFSFFGMHIADDGVAGIVGEALVTLLIWTTLWIAVPRLLVSAQVPLRALVLAGISTGVGLTLLLIATRVVMPTINATVTGNYGVLGLVFLTISWLFVFAVILVTSTIVTRTVLIDDGRLGTRLRQWTGEVPRHRDQARSADRGPMERS